MQERMKALKLELGRPFHNLKSQVRPKSSHKDILVAMAIVIATLATAEYATVFILWSSMIKGTFPAQPLLFALAALISPGICLARILPPSDLYSKAPSSVMSSVVLHLKLQPTKATEPLLS